MSGDKADGGHGPHPTLPPYVNDAVLPYGTRNPSSGFSGTDTSEERARLQDADGTTARRQRAVYNLLWAAGKYGATWKEIADETGWHHGQASGALSNLHKVGRISRLSARRSRCKVYVLPEFVNGRETESCAARRRSTDWADILREWAEADDPGPLDFRGNPVPERMQYILNAGLVQSPQL